ncbi:hypothetical protein [Vibrio barjaei]|uniref:hypothetical protein n=1 Tax=Vibrio barjaei TaxID=1676683 RepID=UPI0007BBF1A7|nr:hypothetical protein [Vibrio barjaei]OIN24672.1 hypothetical protein AWH66_2019765 [Vibrio barjaei]
MSEKLKGKALDTRIEHELLEMLNEGYERSPITQANLYRRLKDKNVISSKATLTSRKNLIETFAKEQVESLEGTFGESVKGSRSMSRKELETANANLTDQVKESRRMVQKNTTCILSMIKVIRAQTTVKNIERCLSPYLIRELHELKVADKSDYDE